MPMRSSQIEGMSVESSGTNAFLHTGMVNRSKQNRDLKFGEGKCDVDLPSENYSKLEMMAVLKTINNELWSIVENDIEQ
jgi:hypothetical protein